MIKKVFSISGNQKLLLRKMPLKKLDRLNQEHKTQVKKTWKLDIAMRRISLKNSEGKKPT